MQHRCSFVWMIIVASNSSGVALHRDNYASHKSPDFCYLDSTARAKKVTRAIELKMEQRRCH